MPVSVSNDVKVICILAISRSNVHLMNYLKLKICRNTCVSGSPQLFFCCCCYRCRLSPIRRKTNKYSLSEHFMVSYATPSLKETSTYNIFQQVPPFGSVLTCSNEKSFVLQTPNV